MRIGNREKKTYFKTKEEKSWTLKNENDRTTTRGKRTQNLLWLSALGERNSRNSQLNKREKKINFSNMKNKTKKNTRDSREIKANQTRERKDT